MGLVGLLLLLALPRGPAEHAPCTEPAEARGEAGHTLEVSCDGGAPLRGPARLLYGLSLDPNRADARALEVLPGIGPARAGAIVTERARAPYESTRDLLRVHGIGPKTLERLRGLVAVERSPESR